MVLLATCGAAGTVMILLEASRFLLTGVKQSPLIWCDL